MGIIKTLTIREKKNWLELESVAYKCIGTFLKLLTLQKRFQTLSLLTPWIRILISNVLWLPSRRFHQNQPWKSDMESDSKLICWTDFNKVKGLPYILLKAKSSFLKVLVVQGLFWSPCGHAPSEYNVSRQSSSKNMRVKRKRKENEVIEVKILRQLMI
jgi:hypothetical protein